MSNSGPHTLIHWKDGIVPTPPYYANVFNYLVADDLSGYDELDEQTLELAHAVDGFLGYESHKANGRGAFISYWRDLESIDRWRRDATHKRAKQQGRKQWYKYYHSKVVRVEQANYHEISSD